MNRPAPVRLVTFFVASGFAATAVGVALTSRPITPALVGPSTTGSPSALAVGVGLLISFILPGYALTRLLNRARELNRLEQAFCVPALSMATIVLGGVISDLTGFTLTKPTWTYLLAGVAEAALVLDLALDMLLPPRGVYEAPKSVEPEMPGPRHTVRTKLVVAGVLSAIVAVSVVVMVAGEHDAVSHEPIPATALGMVPAFANEKPAAMKTMAIYVWNGEGRDLAFTIKFVATGWAGTSVTHRVFNDAQWATQVKVPSVGKVTAELFRPGDTKPYRTVFEAPQDQT